MNEVLADQEYGVPVTPVIHNLGPADGPSLTLSEGTAVPPASQIQAYVQLGQAQRRRDELLARLEHQFWPICGQHPKPNAYRCQCSFVRLIHWEHHKCPRCGLTRAQSRAYTEEKAAAEAVKIAKEKAKYYS